MSIFSSGPPAAQRRLIFSLVAQTVVLDLKTSLSSVSEVQRRVGVVCPSPSPQSPSLLQKAGQDVEETLMDAGLWSSSVLLVLIGASSCFGALLHRPLQLHLFSEDRRRSHTAAMLLRLHATCVTVRILSTCRGSPALAPSRVGENQGLKIFSQITWRRGGEEGERRRDGEDGENRRRREGRRRGGEKERGEEEKRGRG